MSAAENRFTHDRVEQPHNVRVRGLSRPGTDKMCEETLHPSAGAQCGLESSETYGNDKRYCRYEKPRMTMTVTVKRR